MMLLQRDGHVVIMGEQAVTGLGDLVSRRFCKRAQLATVIKKQLEQNFQFNVSKIWLVQTSILGTIKTGQTYSVGSEAGLGTGLADTMGKTSLNERCLMSIVGLTSVVRSSTVSTR